MTEPSKPKRRYERAKLTKGLAVAWQCGEQKELSRVETVAMGGLFIRTAKPAPVGASVQLSFKLPGGDVSARAIVRNSKTGEGMGVEFVGMDQVARVRLHSTVKRLQAALEQLRPHK